MNYRSGRHLSVRLGALAIIFMVSSFAANASQLVQVGDLVLNIPDNVSASFDPESPSQKPRFDYARYSPATGRVRQVDTIFIKLDRIWPMEQRKRGPVVAIDANVQAPELDLFCRSTSRLGAKPDPSKAVRKDGPFYVYEEKLTAGDVYLSDDDFRVFGGLATSWVYEDPLAKMTYPKDAKNYLFAPALTNITRLHLQIVTYQVSVDEMPAMFDSLERQLRSWLVSPGAGNFQWYHQRPGACEL
ncbi:MULTISPECIES: hypothetical protein [Mesorhizobium]|uniref:hypothetical protein n=1 Tax=Mesorhizobium TaxID=68287 RepID=UPI0010A96A49|nr:MULTISPECIES: hypothetical protein [Mesorhizobium]